MKVFLFLLWICCLSAQTRINCGGAVYTDSKGQAWVADAHFLSGTTYNYPFTPPGDDPTIYKTMRYGTFAYSIPVTAGNYNLTLKFLEPAFDARPGSRLFRITVNGTVVLDNFDLRALAPSGTPIDRTFYVVATGGAVTIQATTIKKNAVMSGIELVPAATPPTEPPPTGTTGMATVMKDEYFATDPSMTAGAWLELQNEPAPDTLLLCWWEPKQQVFNDVRSDVVFTVVRPRFFISKSDTAEPKKFQVFVGDFGKLTVVYWTPKK